MIIYEPNYLDNPQLIRIYSDIGAQLIQVDTGNIYSDVVIDCIDARHVYIESNIEEQLTEIPDELFEMDQETTEAWLSKLEPEETENN